MRRRGLRQENAELYCQLEQARSFIASHAQAAMEKGDATTNDVRRALGLRALPHIDDLARPSGWVELPIPERPRWWWKFQRCKSVAEWGSRCEWARGHTGKHGMGMEQWSG